MVPVRPEVGAAVREELVGCSCWSVAFQQEDMLHSLVEQVGLEKVQAVRLGVGACHMAHLDHGRRYSLSWTKIVVYERFPSLRSKDCRI